MAKSAKKFYAVLKGRSPGIYGAWFGKGGAHEQIDNFPGALYKGFPSHDEACSWASSMGFPGLPDHTGSPTQRAVVEKKHECVPEDGPGVVIYADGGSINNPGPGGYGVVVIEDGRRTELSGGYRLTTNNRMELTAAIMGLKSLGGRKVSPVTVCTDSRYVVDGIMKGWARRWRRNGWMRDSRSRAENIDLWSVLLDLSDTYSPTFVWVKGHAGHRENERCDALAKQAARSPDLPADSAYEKGETGVLQPTLF
ncbi:MAG TPA: ribonuclease HI [Deltaproteobacteria bacterium]|jgi:ribonuclease HI|nr:ribonuclease HI [Deltaproteobacteria bacterium]HOI08067.1 ribonuclease HI [Deltaproteobacteria bacterium]